MVRWSLPRRTAQELEERYTVTIENPHYGKTEDVEIARLRKAFGAEKVVVLRKGEADLSLTWGGYEGDKTAMTTPRDRQLDIGFWSVNAQAAHYDRALLRFDLGPLAGKKVKQAWLRLTVRPNQTYLPSSMKGSFPVYPMLKQWKEGDGVAHVDERGLGKGLPNVHYQAWPVKWEKPLASGPADHGRAMAELVPTGNDGNVLPGAKADITGLVSAWLDGTLPNHGMLLGNDLPDELAGTHPGQAKGAYLKLYDGGLVPFYSSDEPDDADFRPRLVVVLE